MKKKIMIGLAAVLGLAAIVGGSVFAALYFTGTLNQQPPPEVAAAVAEPMPENTYYYNLQPEFVVNFRGSARVKYLMIEMSVATHDEDVIPILQDHDPELRNAMLDLLSEQNAEDLKTLEGKQALREQAVALADEIVARYYKSERVYDIFITRLVMQ